MNDVQKNVPPPPGRPKAEGAPSGGSAARASGQAWGHYLPYGLPGPEPDALTEPYWQGLREERLRVQHCSHCGAWQFGPEWLCHQCLAFDPDWEDVEPVARIFSWERVWHAAHPSLRDHGPYLVVLVELPHAGNVRMIGNLLGDPMQEVRIGDPVRGVYQHRDDGARPYSLLQWRLEATP